MALGRTPNFDRIWAACPHAQLAAHGPDVGLPEGQMGNSEVGHTNIGAGRVVWMDLPRIDNAVADGSFAKGASRPLTAAAYPGLLALAVTGASDNCLRSGQASVCLRQCAAACGVYVAIRALISLQVPTRSG